MMKQTDIKQVIYYYSLSLKKILSFLFNQVPDTD